MEVLPLEFVTSKELSNHIVKHQLGTRYPNIAGIVRMEQHDVQWDFIGGFPTDMYRIICQELNLDNEGTSAKPIGFTSFKDLYSRAQK